MKGPNQGAAIPLTSVASKVELPVMRSPEQSKGQVPLSMDPGTSNLVPSVRVLKPPSDQTSQLTLNSSLQYKIRQLRSPPHC